MSRTTALLGFCVGLAAAGCAGSKSLLLDDQAALFHDDLRWGRMSAAQNQLAPGLRARFARRHTSWGRGVRVMDLELEPVNVHGLAGTVRARYVWTRADDVETRETLVETHWLARFDGSWVCDDEHVVGGDPSLWDAR